ncbi:eukaryotic-like serine/threonine-protein kinase [Frankia sp. AiPs1]|uniref:serine/threonine-protein kinase n=1 Tax=Frankia sp. AiPa1 TaxID=573492 RepID=UPI00202AC40B|nr:serine/threonine-protein kinase [Frankia sp. AiPa1]MCL9758712.1 protein kinase [Frankia sp. AiPa1]
MIVDRERVAKALPGYELGEQLGSGAFGLVLAGTHRQMGRPVAIKVVEARGTAAAAAGFAAEARVLGRLDHPHVVRVYDYVEDSGLCMVVMELLAGGTLNGRRAAMSPERICAVALAAAAALEHAHRHKVLHRDIKADNVMFTADGTLKVTDFGIAKLFEGSGTTASGIAGTPAYMAPEQIEGGQLGPWTDLYALGIVLYSLFTGRLPFDPKTPLLTLLSQQISEPPPSMAGVAAPLADLVVRMLAKSPADRPPDAATFALELAAAATAVFGVGWAARGQLPLFLGDAVRAATDRPSEPARWRTGSPVPAAGPDSLGLDQLVPIGTGGGISSVPPKSEPPKSEPPTPDWPTPEPSAPDSREPRERALTGRGDDDITFVPPTPEPLVSAPPNSLPPTSEPLVPDGRGSEVAGLPTEVVAQHARRSADGSGEKPPTGSPAASPAEGPRRRRDRGAWIVGAVALVLVVAVALVGLVIYPDLTSPRHSTAHPSASASAGTVPVVRAAGSPSSGPRGTAAPTAGSAVPPSGSSPATAVSTAPTDAGATHATTADVTLTHAPTANALPEVAAHPTASAIRGINGGDDRAQVPGSEADTVWVANAAACSAWLDDNGSGALAGVLNTSLTQACAANLYRSDGMAYTFSASWGAAKTNFIPVSGYTMWICVWRAGDQSNTEVCSARFGLNGTTPVRR